MQKKDGAVVQGTVNVQDRQTRSNCDEVHGTGKAPPSKVVLDYGLTMGMGAEGQPDPAQPPMPQSGPGCFGPWRSAGPPCSQAGERAALKPRPSALDAL